MQFYSMILQRKKSFQHDSGRKLKQAIRGVVKSPFLEVLESLNGHGPEQLSEGKSA